MRALPFAVPAFALWAGATLAQEAIDRRLVDAGFVMRSVDTPKQMEQARRLPQRTIVSRMRDGQRHYLYADTEYCRCVLAGNAQALQAYRDMALPPVRLPRRHRAARRQSGKPGGPGHGLRLHGSRAGPHSEFPVLSRRKNGHRRWSGSGQQCTTALALFLSLGGAVRKRLERIPIGRNWNALQVPCVGSNNQVRRVASRKDRPGETSASRI